MIKNLTPHDVVVCDESGTVLRTFPSVGLARCSEITEPAGEIDGIPRVRKTFGSVAGLPEKEEGVFLVVSGLVKAACPDRDDLVQPADLVRDDAGRVIGCKSFC